MNKKIIDKKNYKIICSEDFDEKSIVPVFCSLCERMIRTKDDEKTAQQYMCCFYCSINFVYPNIELWKKGWRPSRSEINNTLEGIAPIISIDLSNM